MIRIFLKLTKPETQPQKQRPAAAAKPQRVTRQEMTALFADELDYGRQLA